MKNVQKNKIKTVEANKTRGGARANSGRAKVEDKKVPLTLYIRQSRIDAMGGAAKLREIIFDRLKFHDH